MTKTIFSCDADSTGRVLPQSSSQQQRSFALRTMIAAVTKVRRMPAPDLDVINEGDGRDETKAVVRSFRSLQSLFA
ncbi:MAG TPA: hypothetical protein VG206_15565 [Terriglobia bacterium]|nr:hypothetical protein [Terriglobia bacterium]